MESDDVEDANGFVKIDDNGALKEWNPPKPAILVALAREASHGNKHVDRRHVGLLSQNGVHRSNNIRIERVSFCLWLSHGFVP